jgi:hypothetical protein
VQRTRTPRVSPRGQSRVSFNGQQKSILLVVKKTFVCRLKELSTAIDPVSVGGGFGFSENPGRPLGHLAERCAIYLQPHHILLGYVCDRYSRSDSAWRESNHLFLPKHQTLTIAMVHIGYLKFAPKGTLFQRETRFQTGPLKKKSSAPVGWLNHFAAPSSYLGGDHSGGAADVARHLAKANKYRFLWSGDRETVRRISAEG